MGSCRRYNFATQAIFSNFLPTIRTASAVHLGYFKYRLHNTLGSYRRKRHVVLSFDPEPHVKHSTFEPIWTNQSGDFVSNCGNPRDIIGEIFEKETACWSSLHTRTSTTVPASCQELRAGQNEGPSVSPRAQSTLKPILSHTLRRRLSRPCLHPQRWPWTLPLVLTLQLVRVLLLLLPRRS